jgi:murein DD-endopeptidase MepM/ murein hydrolase activator NlpD
MIDVLAHYVDFYHQKQGDKFKIVYEKHLVEGKEVGTGKILAALYEREGKQFYAFNYETQGESCKYFDIEGRPAKKAFLKSPVKFSRISSRYSLNRLHPILGYSRPHFGTDYAAAHGTPILAIADGTILEATRRGGNGNFVKMRHDGTYESQYLHMSHFAKGIKPGVRVTQGQTIGFVGSTGLATGPHCCFRFWKNGKQVDHTRLDLPTALPMKGAALEAFNVERDRFLQMLNQVNYRTQEEIYKEKSVETVKVNP